MHWQCEQAYVVHQESVKTASRGGVAHLLLNSYLAEEAVHNSSSLLEQQVKSKPAARLHREGMNSAKSASVLTGVLCSPCYPRSP